MKPTASALANYKPDIDGLRGLAIISVILFHAFPDYFPGGFAGVDVFFVISGFLITGIIKSRIDSDDFSFLNFYSRRVRRLFPSLILVLGTCFVAGWFLFDVGDFKILGKHIAASSGFVSNFTFLSESGYFDQTAITKPLLHVWSLSVEEQFYFLWPLIIVTISKIRKSLSLVLGGIVLTSFLLSLYFSYHNSAFAYYFPLCRFWELAVGALLNYLPLQDKDQNERFLWTKLISGTALIGLMASPFLIDGAATFPGWWALLPVLSTTSLIVFSGRCSIVKSFLTHRSLVWIGLISYPLYLIHWPLLSFYKIVTLETPNLIVGSAILILSLILSSVVYRYVELPVRNKGLRGTTISLLILMISIGVLGLNVFSRDGYPFRPIAEEKMASNIEVYNQPLPDAICTDKSCLPELGAQNKQTVFFWGDSVTANITYGLTKKRADGLNIQPIVLMEGACPPIDGYFAKSDYEISCNQFRLKGYEIIRKYKPKVVMLFADWILYLTDKKYSRLHLDDMIPTIDRIKSLGVERVIIVGQFPLFEATQVDIGRRLFKPGTPPFTTWLLNKNIFAVDEYVRHFTEENNARFLSPLDFLCNGHGCQFSASTDEYIPMAYDTLHMTPNGAGVLFERAITPSLFGN